MVASRRHALVILLFLTAALLFVSCGGGERSAAPAQPTATASAAPAAEAGTETVVTETAEAQPTATSAETAPVEDQVPEPANDVKGEFRVLVVGADGHHRGDVMKVLGDVAGKVRKGDFLDLSVGGKHTVSWVSGSRRVVVIDFADFDAFKAGVKEGPWSGALFVSNPAQSTGNRDAFLDAASAAGIRKVVFFQVVSDLLTDMEVYDLEAQVWPDILSNKGFAGEGMPTLQADVARAAKGDAKERKAFENLIKAIESTLAK